MSERNYWQRMSAKRLSRRSLLRASSRAGVGAAGLALVGCGDDDDDDQQTAAQVQQQQQDQPQPAQQQQAQQQQQQQQQQTVAQTQQQQEQQADATAQQVQQQEEDDQPAATTTEAGGKTYGGTLRFSTPAATHDFFDPHRGVFGPTQYWMGFYMNYLIRWGNKEGGIMESDISSLPEQPDGETYIFNIDRGARFWDQYPTEGGREVTAQDIDINFQRNIDALDADGNPDARFRGQDAFRKTDSRETPDDRTFIARTAGPDATYLGGTILRPFSWITSPEAIQEFGTRWRDETANVELSSGTGPFIPQSYDPDIGIYLERNNNYWKNDTVTGQQLPYPDAVEFVNLTDSTAVEAAYRGKGIDIGGFPLSSVQVEELSGDFPDHPVEQGAFGFTIVTVMGTYEPGWEGSDGLGNPYLDRRFAYAMHTAIDRDLLIDAVYLGAARPSATHYCPWFSAYWTVPPEELRTIPGFRLDREADIALTRELIDASGFDKDRTVTIYIPDLWEQTYPGITETTRNMYREATGINVELDIQPYTVMQDRYDNKTFPGRAPTWTNPPADLDPTAQFTLSLKVGGASNLTQYNYGPVEDIVDEMALTLDTEQRRDLALQVQRIGLGVDDEHGLDGIFGWFGVMNGVAPTIVWPYVNRDNNTWQFAHDSHNHDDTWLDTEHAEFPA